MNSVSLLLVSTYVNWRKWRHESLWGWRQWVMTRGSLRGIVWSWTFRTYGRQIMNIWNASVSLAVLQMSKHFFLFSSFNLRFLSQMNVCNKKIHCVRADEIPLCYSLGNWLINIFIVPLNVVLDFSVKLFQVMKSSWLASLKCLSLFFPWLFCSCPVAPKFWTCHRNSTLWPLVFRFLCTRNELVYC